MHVYIIHECVVYLWWSTIHEVILSTLTYLQYISIYIWVCDVTHNSSIINGEIPHSRIPQPPRGVDGHDFSCSRMFVHGWIVPQLRRRFASTQPCPLHALVWFQITQKSRDFRRALFRSALIRTSSRSIVASRSSIPRGSIPEGWGVLKTPTDAAEGGRSSRLIASLSVSLHCIARKEWDKRKSTNKSGCLCTWIAESSIHQVL